MQNEGIVFYGDPAQISAFVTYIGGNLYQHRWEMDDGRYKDWGFQEQLHKNNVKSITVSSITFSNRFPIQRIMKRGRL